VFFQGFVYTTASGITAIPLPQGATTLNFVGPVISINNHGTVTGSSDAGAWTWSSSQGTVLLNSQVPAGWNISQVSGINDNGVILAYASFNSGLVQQVELIPSPLSGTPAPSTLLLLLIGLTGVRFGLPAARVGHKRGRWQDLDTVLCPVLRGRMRTLAVLHGSQVTGHAHNNSDWDVAILRDHILTREERAQLRNAFARKLGVQDDALGGECILTAVVCSVVSVCASVQAGRRAVPGDVGGIRGVHRDCEGSSSRSAGLRFIT
jgi:hypothetical protein